LVELFADGDVPLVGRHHEAGVGEPFDLAADRVDHAGGGVADVDDGDPGREVDPLVAVDVDDRAAAGSVHIGRYDGTDAAGHRRRAPLVQFCRRHHASMLCMTCLIRVYSSSPYTDRSLPYPECLNPPCGISATIGMWVFTQTQPKSSRRVI